MALSSSLPNPLTPRPGRRRRAAALGAAAALAATALTPVLAPAASAAEPPPGLFGTADPQYDGVWRQSVALLAQDTAGYAPGTAAVDWLLAQQCADGSFLSYRADPEVPCADVTAADSNATALAAQALAAVGGHDDAVDSALAWLAGVQNADGGWSYNPGGATDANSTAVVVGAFAAAGQDPAAVVRDDRSPYDALAALQLGCAAAEDERGAFAWQPAAEDAGELAANGPATVDAVLASYGSGLLVDPDTEPVAPLEALDCTDDSADDSADDDEATETPTETPTETAEPLPANLTSGSAGAAQLAALLADGEQHLVAAVPGASAEDEEQPDYGSTARAVIALAAGGHPEAAQGALDWLRENLAGWTDYATNPSAVGLLVLAAHAAGASPTDFGGTDLVDTLNSLGPAPDDSGTAGTGAGPETAADDGGSGVLPWVIGIGLAIGIAIGVVLSLRRRRPSA